MLRCPISLASRLLLQGLIMLTAMTSLLTKSLHCTPYAQSSCTDIVSNAGNNSHDLMFSCKEKCIKRFEYVFCTVLITCSTCSDCSHSLPVSLLSTRIFYCDHRVTGRDTTSNGTTFLNTEAFPENSMSGNVNAMTLKLMLTRATTATDDLVKTYVIFSMKINIGQIPVWFSFVSIFQFTFQENLEISIIQCL